MAVEATHHTLFHPQMMMNNNNQTIGNTNTPLSYGINHPLSAMYTNGFNDSVNVFSTNNIPVKAESGLTSSFPVSRKRIRDSSDINCLSSFVNIQNMQQINRSGSYTFLGEDISNQFQQQQKEIDQFIANHTEKVRMEIEDIRKRNSRRIIAAVEDGISKRLRAKEEEIIKIAKLNWALEEKVKSLCVENQTWRDLAQTKEAAVNSLRNNLKQVLEQVIVNDDYRNITKGACADELAEDAQSCCESNSEENRLLNDECSSINANNNINRLCKKCGKDESCVLLLPCRHLCLCTGCASSVNVCPVCKSVKTLVFM